MDNKTLLEELDYYVVGHTEAKKALITLVMRSRLRHFQKYIKEMDSDYLLQPMKILLMGASGSGKTHLVESLQKITHFPLLRIDATHLGPSGSGGSIKPNDLRKMIIEKATIACDLSPNRYYSVEEAVDSTVVFVDEIDKLGVSFDSSGNWNSHVQSNFLTLFDNKAEFSGLSFVFAGAFTGITKEKETKRSIGFSFNETIGEDEFLDDQIIKYGLIPELANTTKNL